MALPLIIAAEIAYLGLLGTHEKLGRYVDAQEHKRTREEKSSKASENLRRIKSMLPRASKKRYTDLADRCEKLQEISSSLQIGSTDSETITNLQLESLDRLLWMYLKLLYTEHMLRQFLESTDEAEIQNQIGELKDRIQTEELRPAAQQRDRVLSTLRDDLATCESRLRNYQKAAENFELVELELRRLENKIQSLSEMAINRKDPSFVSGQVDEVAGSMLQTQRTLNELEFVTGMHSEQDEEAPELMRRRTVPTRS